MLTETPEPDSRHVPVTTHRISQYSSDTPRKTDFCPHHSPEFPGSSLEPKSGPEWTVEVRLLCVPLDPSFSVNPGGGGLTSPHSPSPTEGSPDVVHLEFPPSPTGDDPLPPVHAPDRLWGSEDLTPALPYGPDTSEGEVS